MKTNQDSNLSSDVDNQSTSMSLQVHGYKLSTLNSTMVIDNHRIHRSSPRRNRPQYGFHL